MLTSLLTLRRRQSPRVMRPPAPMPRMRWYS